MQRGSVRCIYKSTDHPLYRSGHAHQPPLRIIWLSLAVMHTFTACPLRECIRTNLYASDTLCSFGYQQFCMFNFVVSEELLISAGETGFEILTENFKNS